MEIIISARHFEMTAEMKENIEAKLQTLQEEYNKLTTARVVLSMEKAHRFHVEIHLEGKQLHLDAHFESHDPFEAIQLSLEKLDKQLRKHVGKIQHHKGSPRLAEVQVEEPLEEEMETVS